MNIWRTKIYLSTTRCPLNLDNKTLNILTYFKFTPTQQSQHSQHCRVVSRLAVAWVISNTNLPVRPPESMGWIGRYGKVWRSDPPGPRPPPKFGSLHLEAMMVGRLLWLFFSGSYTTTFLKNFWKLFEVWRMKLKIRIQHLENLCLSEFLFLAFHMCHLPNFQNLVVHQSGAWARFRQFLFARQNILRMYGEVP